MTDLPVETRLSTEWELWVVENLLFTAKRDDLAALLVAQGLDADEAARQIARIASNPGFARIRARLAEATLALRLDRLNEQLAPQVDVPVRESITADELLERFWIPSRPVKLTAVARTIPAMRWTLDSLAARFPDATVEVNVGRELAGKPSDTEKHARRLAVPEFVRRAQSETTNALYVVSRNGWLADPQFAALWGDLAPLPEILAPVERPLGVSMWVGPAGTRTPPHFDPHNVLLVQVEGRKRVTLAPRVRASHAGFLDGYYLDGTLEERFGERVRSVEIGPGESLFVPAGWYHAVEALSPSITLSFLSFRWPNHFHFVGPSGSDDAREVLR